MVATNQNPSTEDRLDDSNTVIKDAYAQLAMIAFEGGKGDMSYTEDEMLDLLDRLKATIELNNSHLESKVGELNGERT